MTVTGAAGFVGSNLCRAFLESDHSVRVWATDLIDSPRLQDLHGHDDFTFEEYDAHQPIHSDMLAVDTFHHFAGIANPEVYLNNPILVMDLNLDGLRNVLERISKWSSHRPRMVYSSTSEVYGKNYDVPFREVESNLVFGPTQKRRWCYALTKAVGEHYLQAYNERFGIPYTIFRFFNFVGKDIDAPGSGRVITKMVGDALEKGEIRVTKPGKQTRSFCYVDDFVKALQLPTYLKKTREGFREENHILNLGSVHEVSMEHLAYMVRRRLREEHGRDCAVRLVDADELYGKGYDDVMRRLPDVAKAEEQLGWKAELEPEEFIPGIVDAAAALAVYG